MKLANGTCRKFLERACGARQFEIFIKICFNMVNNFFEQHWLILKRKTFNRIGLFAKEKKLAPEPSFKTIQLFNSFNRLIQNRIVPKKVIIFMIQINYLKCNLP